MSDFVGIARDSVERPTATPDITPTALALSRASEPSWEVIMSTRMIDRRRFPRFVLEPMYTPISARTMDSESFDLEGHAYDISEGGLRFELDKPVAPGTRIALQITLPTADAEDLGPGRSVFVFATVVWIEDEEEPAPYKMAAVFSHFARAGDRDRLLRHFATGRYRAAA